MDNFLPIIIGLIIVLFIYAFIREARKQKQAASSLFRDIAGKHGWSFREEDDGTIQDLARDFQAIGVFYSPSLGKRIPKNVITGSVPLGTVYVFQHYRRIYEGYALNFNVCLIRLKEPLAGPMVVRFKKGKARLSNDFYTAPEIAAPEQWKNDIVIHGKNENESRQLLNDTVLQSLIPQVNALPWRVDAEIQGDCIAVYISERNADIENEDDFRKLLDFTQTMADVLIKQKNKPV